jgi:hypothetical protein
MNRFGAGWQGATSELVRAPGKGGSRPEKIRGLWASLTVEPISPKLYFQVCANVCADRLTLS